MSPTLNAFDNATEARATVVIIGFSHTQGLSAQPSETVFPTLRVEGGGMAVSVNGEISHTLTNEGADASEAGTGRGTPIVAYGIDSSENGWVEQMGTLTSGKSSGGTQQVVAQPGASIVRRLTPTECERLQGFPDDWTAQRFDFKKNKVVEQADSNRYKQMGNAVAVPCVDWIVARLVAADEEDCTNG